MTEEELQEELDNLMRLIKRNTERQMESGPRKKKGLYNHVKVKEVKE